MRPDRAQFGDYPVLDDGRGKRWMRQAGDVLRFWISVLGLVIGLQSVCIAAHSDDLKSPDRAVQASETQASETPVSETQVSQAPVNEVTPKRDRDHSARSLQEMLILFLKGVALLIVIVLVYKGLKRWFGRKRESE